VGVEGVNVRLAPSEIVEEVDLEKLFQ